MEEVVSNLILNGLMEKYLKVKGKPGSSFKLKIKKENSIKGNDINKEVVINNNGEYILEN